MAAAAALHGPSLSPPHVLPGAASAARVSTWLVGARPSRETAALARRAGARRVMPGGYELATSRAQGFARALRRRGLLVYSEPNVSLHLFQAPRAIPDDPLSPQARWRDAAVDPSLLPPAVTPTSPLLALVDSKLDTTHPEFQGGNVTSLPEGVVGNEHGTATAAVAAAPKNDVGILGIWPGMRALNVPLPSESISCSEAAGGVLKALKAGAAVINMSYGSPSFCYLEYAALQLAVERGTILVAAAGNEFDRGNPLEFPASLPHVLTVAALTPDDTAAFFSNENAAIDLAAPGVGILTAVPMQFDEDGTKDGYEVLDGTSFAAPMVAAATTWVRAARPDLQPDQVAEAIRLSARDVGRRGYDASTGFGALDVARALERKATRHDPLEPNEDIPFVNGAAFGKVDAPIWRGTGATRLFALLDYYEDPTDVYRLRLPAGRSVRISVKPTFGNPDLEAYAAAAKHVGTVRHRLGRSLLKGTHTDRLALTNQGTHTTTIYVRVFIRGNQRSLDAGYDLTVR